MLQAGSQGIRRACALLAVLAASAVAAQPAHAQVPVAPTAAKAASIRRYWTPQRMRAALPVAAAGAEVPAIGGSESKRALHQRVRHITRRPLRSHGKVFFTISPYKFQCSATAA